jgi:hypothetical protein
MGIFFNEYMLIKYYSSSAGPDFNGEAKSVDAGSVTPRFLRGD